MVQMADNKDLIGCYQDSRMAVSILADGRVRVEVGRITWFEWLIGRPPRLPQKQPYGMLPPTGTPGERGG